MKKILSIFLVGTLLMSLVGCAGGKDDNVGDGNVKYNDGDKIVVSTIYHKSLDRFEELVETTYEDIDFVVEHSTLSTYNGDVLRRLRNGHGRELILTSMPNSEFSDYMLDLSAEEFSTRYENAIMEIIRNEGRTICLPMPSVYNGIIINKTLVEQLGMEMPDTQQGLIDLLQKAMDNNVGIGEDGTVFATRNTAGIPIGEMVLSIMVPDFLGTMEGERWVGGFLEKETQMQGTIEPYLAFAFEIINRGYMDPTRLDPSAYSTRAVDVKTRMKNRELIAAYATTDILREIRMGNAEDEFIMIPFLSNKGNQEWVVSAPTAYMGINKAVKDDEKMLDACKRVLDLLSSAEGQEAVLYDTQTDKSYLNSEKVKLVEKSDTGLERYIEDGYVYYLNRFNSDILWLLGNNFTFVSNGDMELSDALEEIDDFNKNGPTSNSSDRTLVGSVGADLLFENYNTRYYETAIGNLIADAVAEVSGADIAVINGGAIRASLYEGDVYVSDLAEVCPYQNTIVTLEVTGAVLREMMENSISGIYYKKTPSGKFLQVHGIHYAITVDKTTEEIYENNAIPAKAELISLTLPDGTPVDDDKIYKVAVSSYMCGIPGYEDGGGDGYTMLNVFCDSVPKAEGVTLVESTGITHAEALIQYFKNHSNDVISAKTEGRIQVEEVER